MANVMLGHTNRVDAGTLSGGSWLAALPVTNLQSRLLGKVARSTDALKASTQFDADLGAAHNIRLLAWSNHNLTVNSRYRVRGAGAADFAAPIVDSGWADVWPVVYLPEDLEWEDNHWWEGKYSDEEREGYVPVLTHILDANVNARYWRVEFDDEANPDGHVQIGRAFIGPALQPLLNMSFGVQIGWEPRTGVSEALSGAEYFRRRNPYRVARFALNYMDEGDAWARAFEIKRRSGIDREVLFVYDPRDTRQSLRRRFLGRLRQLSPIEHPHVNRYTTAFELKELLP